MNVILISTESRNFPVDIEEPLTKAGHMVKRVASLGDFLCCSERCQSYLAIFEIGSLEDYPSAYTIYDWMERVQPIAPTRYLLLVATRNLEIKEKLQIFSNAEIAILPMPVRNILFKAELQIRLLQQKQTIQEGFVLIPASAAGAQRDRLLVFKGPSPEKGEWRSGEGGPSGKVRWRWIPSQEEKSGEQEKVKLSWVAEAMQAPTYDSESKLWLMEHPPGDLLCFSEEVEVFSAAKINDSLKNKQERAADSKPKAIEISTNESTGISEKESELDKEERINNEQRKEDNRIEKLQELEKQNDLILELLKEKSLTKTRKENTEPLKTKKDQSSGAVASKEQEKHLVAPDSLSNSILSPVAQKNEPESHSVSRENIEDNIVEMAGNEAITDPLLSKTMGQEDNAVAALVENSSSLASQAKSKLSAERILTNAYYPGNSKNEKNQERVNHGEKLSLQKDESLEEKNSEEIAVNTKEITETAEKENPSSKAEDALDSGAGIEVVSGVEKQERPFSQEQALNVEPAQKTALEKAIEESAGRKSPDLQVQLEVSSIKRTEEEKNIANLESSSEEQSLVSPSNEDLNPILYSDRVEGKKSQREGASVSSGNLERDYERNIKGKVDGPSKNISGIYSRFHLTMSLEELQDKNSSWHPVENYRIYLSANHRYYGVKNMEEIFPLWVYEGELAPEFLDEKKAWRFYDRAPQAYYSLETLPLPVFKFFSDLPEVKRIIEEKKQIFTAQKKSVAMLPDKNTLQPEPEEKGGFWNFLKKIFFFGNKH